MSKILITGANGFIGANIVRAALAKGYKVKAFVRQTSNLQTIQDLQIDFAYGDLREIESIHKALEDCDYIIHKGYDIDNTNTQNCELQVFFWNKGRGECITAMPGN